MKREAAGQPTANRGSDELSHDGRAAYEVVRERGRAWIFALLIPRLKSVLQRDEMLKVRVKAHSISTSQSCAERGRFAPYCVEGQRASLRLERITWGAEETSIEHERTLSR